MPRTIPEVPGFAPPKPSEPKTYTIQLITPMFGGGVEPGEPDESMPIRATEIRGQLQFWWRATAGAKYSTKEELREAQTEIWGSTEKASNVQVQARTTTAGKNQPCAQYSWNPNARGGRGGWRMNWLPPFQGTKLPYALFPFQGEMPRPNRNAKIEVPPANCIHDAVFELTINCAADMTREAESEVETALWAWVNFGGLGARTRRGCGALFCRDFAPESVEQLVEKARQYATSSARDWPVLVEHLLIGKAERGSIAAWDAAINILRDFRQGEEEEIGRAAGPSRSFWPEAESIREITGCRSHSRDPNIPDSAIPAFPRAEFGLPIVFHFKDSGDPPDTVLYPGNGPANEKRERMASPLILKPLGLADGKFIPIILLLRTPHLTGVDLRISRKNLNSLPRKLAERIRETMGNNDKEGSFALPDDLLICGEPLSEYSTSPMQGRSTTGSAIEAFLNYAQSKGFKGEI
ncbi:MAG: type III-B CRISPR module RAMP protein Cmr1 [Gemmatales bacterium]|nr:MAG: type III-B CRISPR module RAMP protein Cmr1 [Gemmatales bacterium]